MGGGRGGGGGRLYAEGGGMVSFNNGHGYWIILIDKFVHYNFCSVLNTNDCQQNTVVQYET